MEPCREAQGLSGGDACRRGRERVDGDVGEVAGLVDDWDGRLQLGGDALRDTLRDVGDHRLAS